MAALENHKASQQWAEGKVPGMDVWLREERWRQQLPAKGVGAAPDEKMPEWMRKARERARQQQAETGGAA
jgi:hypothetical protein